jgi:hypothetical protein
MRKWRRWVTVSGAALLAGAGVGIAGAAQAEASDAKVPFAVAPPWADATSPVREEAVEFDGRIARPR